MAWWAVAAAGPESHFKGHQWITFRFLLDKHHSLILPPRASHHPARVAIHLGADTAFENPSQKITSHLHEFINFILATRASRLVQSRLMGITINLVSNAVGQRRFNHHLADVNPRGRYARPYIDYRASQSTQRGSLAGLGGTRIENSDGRPCVGYVWLT